MVIVLLGGASARPQAFDPSQLSIGGSAQPVAASRFVTTTTPKPLVPIIRHINRVNNDGSYTFGYESGDGSYRVETKGLDGVIKGKYGYIDEQGVRKEVDYIAGSDVGYEPKGQGITVPPRPPPRPPGQEFLDYDDGSGTTPRPRVRAQQVPVQQFVAQPVARPRPRPQPQPEVVAQAQPVFQQPQFIAAPAPAPAPVAFQPIQAAPVIARQAQQVSAHHAAPARSQGGPSPIESFLRQQLQGAPASF